MDEDATDIPDHIGVELRFLSLLAEEEASAWEKEDPGAAAAVLDRQHQFVSRHLGKWAPGFCRKVEEAAEHPFYGAFAGLLRGCLSGEKADIMDRLDTARAAAPPDGSP
jgi:TorA maturation chaperone TorD